MNSSCINILNKTVNHVCHLQTEVDGNSKDIDFLEKYSAFNKNLILATLGCNITLDYKVFSYSLSPCFLNNHLYQYLLYIVLDYLNQNLKENYYFVATDSTELPDELKDICVPSIVQVSLIEGEPCQVKNIFDEIKELDFTELEKALGKCSKLSSLTIAILKYLCCPAPICLQKCYSYSLTKEEICPFYDFLLKTKKEVSDETDSLINKYCSLCLNVCNPIEGTKHYINYAKETLEKRYKEKSFNNPYFPLYDIKDVLCEAYKLFLCDNNLDVDCQGNVYQSDEPAEPSEPSEPSDFKFTISSISNENLSLNNEIHYDSIEEKIKQLLELTETSTQ